MTEIHPEQCHCQVIKRKSLQTAIDQNLLWTDCVVYLIKHSFLNPLSSHHKSKKAWMKNLEGFFFFFFFFKAHSITFRLLCIQFGQMCFVYFKSPLFITETCCQAHPSLQNKTYKDVPFLIHKTRDSSPNCKKYSHTF